MTLNTNKLSEETVVGLAIEGLQPNIKVHVLAANPNTYEFQPTQNTTNNVTINEFSCNF